MFASMLLPLCEPQIVCLDCVAAANSGATAPYVFTHLLYRAMATVCLSVSHMVIIINY